MQADPYDQFASPYTGMGNDPVNLVDPSGGIGIDFGTLGDLTGSVIADRALVALAGAAIGFGVDKLLGGNGWDGAAIGGGLALGATFIPPFEITTKLLVSIALQGMKIAANAVDLVLETKAVGQQQMAGQGGQSGAMHAGYTQNEQWRNHAENLRQKDGYKQYTQIYHRTHFYRWYAIMEKKRGGETEWAGGAWIVATQVLYLDSYSSQIGATSISKFANAGNKAIFEDVFDDLRDNLKGSPKKGNAAREWDKKTLQHEQYDVVQPIYDEFVKQNPNLKSILQKGASKFAPKELRFSGNIMNPLDRFKHGMGKAIPYSRQYISEWAKYFKF